MLGRGRTAFVRARASLCYVGPAVIDLRVRPRIQGVLQPMGAFLTRLGFSPAAVTLLGFAVALVGAGLVGMGFLVGGGIVYLAGSGLDGLDGAVARVSGRVTARGAFLDATVDRLSEIAVMVGLAVAFRHELRILLLVLLSMGAALLIPYLRAKAEAEGLNGRGGLMGRAERVILVAAGLVSGFVEPMLWIFVVTTWMTVGYRFFSAYRQLAE